MEHLCGALKRVVAKYVDIPEAAYLGDIPLLEWAFEVKNPLRTEIEAAYELACMAGDLEAAQWCRARLGTVLRYNDDVAFQGACEADSVPVAKWVLQFIDSPESVIHWCAKEAAAGRALKILEWLNKEENLRCIARDMFDAACRRGGPKSMEWVAKRFPEEIGVTEFESAFVSCCSLGLIKSAEWLRDNWPGGEDPRSVWTEAFCVALMGSKYEAATWIWVFAKSPHLRQSAMEFSTMLASEDINNFLRELFSK